MLHHSREVIMLACLLAALASGPFARFHCDVRCLFFFSLAQKQFRYAARFASTLTATEQLHTQIRNAAYLHLAIFAPYG